MNFGISFALERLRKSQIYCIQPPKIIVSGRIDTICFDKTGTLTQQGMKISEILPSDTSKTQGTSLSHR
jgi:P-type E1-E2 ATPase